MTEEEKLDHISKHQDAIYLYHWKYKPLYFKQKYMYQNCAFGKTSEKPREVKISSFALTQTSRNQYNLFTRLPHVTSYSFKGKEALNTTKMWKHRPRACLSPISWDQRPHMAIKFNGDKSARVTLERYLQGWTQFPALRRGRISLTR